MIRTRNTSTKIIWITKVIRTITTREAAQSIITITMITVTAADDMDTMTGILSGLSVSPGDIPIMVGASHTAIRITGIHTILIISIVPITTGVGMIRILTITALTTMDTGTDTTGVITVTTTDLQGIMVMYIMADGMPVLPILTILHEVAQVM